MRLCFQNKIITFNLQAIPVQKLKNPWSSSRVVSVLLGDFSVYERLEIDFEKLAIIALLQAIYLGTLS